MAACQSYVHSLHKLCRTQTAKSLFSMRFFSMKPCSMRNALFPGKMNHSIPLLSLSYKIQAIPYQNSDRKFSSSSCSVTVVTNTVSDTSKPRAEEELDVQLELKNESNVSNHSNTLSEEGSHEGDSVSEIEQHPWSEWLLFMERLNESGYNKKTAAQGETSSLYSEQKHAVLNFARDRDDIYSQLSQDQVRALSIHGCPDLDRKGVNAAKRLRKSLSQSEEEVCSQCHLNASCQRVNASPASVAPPGTAEVARLVLGYAQGAGRGREAAGEVVSACRQLLGEMTALCDRPRDPSLPRTPIFSGPSSSATSRPPPRSLFSPPPSPSSSSSSSPRRGWTAPHLRQFSSEARGDKPNLPGDWNCPDCNFHNFARNVSCRGCGAYKPAKTASAASAFVTPGRGGDWHCSECNYLNYARNTSCRECRAPKGRDAVAVPGTSPNRSATAGNVQAKPGDWECPQCTYLNYSRNTECRRCKGRNPSFSSSSSTSSRHNKAPRTNTRSNGFYSGGGRSGGRGEFEEFEEEERAPGKWEESLSDEEEWEEAGKKWGYLGDSAEEVDSGNSGRQFQEWKPELKGIKEEDPDPELEGLLRNADMSFHLRKQWDEYNAEVNNKSKKKKKGGSGRRIMRPSIPEELVPRWNWPELKDEEVSERGPVRRYDKEGVAGNGFRKAGSGQKPLSYVERKREKKVHSAGDADLGRGADRDFWEEYAEGPEERR